MTLPEGAVRVGRERAVRLVAAVGGSRLAPASADDRALYSAPIEFSWRRDVPLSDPPQR